MCTARGRTVWIIIKKTRFLCLMSTIRLSGDQLPSGAKSCLLTGWSTKRLVMGVIPQSQGTRRKRRSWSPEWGGHVAPRTRGSTKTSRRLQRKVPVASRLRWIVLRKFRASLRQLNETNEKFEKKTQKFFLQPRNVRQCVTLFKTFLLVVLTFSVYLLRNVMYLKKLFSINWLFFF